MKKLVKKSRKCPKYCPYPHDKKGRSIDTITGKVIN